jgi:hypothetical protein
MNASLAFFALPNVDSLFEIFDMPVHPLNIRLIVVKFVAATWGTLVSFVHPANKAVASVRFATVRYASVRELLKDFPSNEVTANIRGLLLSTPAN